MCYRSNFFVSPSFTERVAISISTGEHKGVAFYTCSSCGHAYENMHHLKTHRCIRKLPGDCSKKQHLHILSVPQNTQKRQRPVSVRKRELLDTRAVSEQKVELPRTRAVSKKKQERRGSRAVSEKQGLPSTRAVSERKLELPGSRAVSEQKQELPGTRAVSEQNCKHQRQGEAIKSGTRLEINNRTGTTRTRIVIKHLCICGRSFRYPLALQQHIKMYAEARFKCGTCDERFLSEPQLVAHAVALRHEKPFQCSKCVKRFYQCRSLIKHSRVHGAPSYECKCGKRFTDPAFLEWHTKRQHSKYNCPDCHMSFQYSSDYQKHTRTHVVQKVYKCDRCDTCCNTVEQLAARKRTHAREKPPNCSTCGKTFHHFSQAKKHVCKICPTCGKVFTKATEFTIHMRVHTGERPFKCSICSKCFPTRSQLRSHNYTHTKPHLCHRCGKGFAIGNSFKYHKCIDPSMHTVKKPYTCTICNRGFVRSHAYKCHQHIHTGEKPYQCPTCGRGFRFPTSLKLHVLYGHSNRKSFKCTLCDKRYQTPGGLRFHMRRHMGKKADAVCIQAQKPRGVKHRGETFLTF